MNATHNIGLAAESVRAGKLGIALSGGGFRAALFHIGVLARLAQRDLLRHVALISTVSGGSIIGTYYYLKVKQLLEGRRADGLEPSAEAYCRLVKEVESDFLAAMQKNIRIMTFADHRENVRMLASEFTPTQRIGDLFDSCFFAPITGSANNLLRDLAISTSHLEHRDDKGAELGQVVVPRLIINSTALNTGHLFQFTGTHIGEPSVSSVLGGSTAMPRLRRLYMDDPALSAAQRARLDQIKLGEAVAASCCVPGLLEPLSLGGLYHDEGGGEVAVRLVDGGVFDNQGLVSLFEEGCTHFVVSDGSDLLQWHCEPADLIHSVAMRANDIMMDRIRLEVMEELLQRKQGHFAVFTLGSPDGSEVFGSDTPGFLQSLKAIRTDLDAFSDIEAWSLMYHGYMVSEPHLAEGQSKADETLPGAQPAEDYWDFAGIRRLAEDVSERKRLLRHLNIGSRQFLKVFYLGKPLPWFIATLPTLIPLSLSIFLIRLMPPIPTSAWVVLGVLVVSAIAYAQNARIIEWLDQVEAFKRFRKKLVVALKPLGITMALGGAGALASLVNLRIFNALFLRYGGLDERRRSG